MKKIFIIMICSILILAVTACGSTDEDVSRPTDATEALLQKNVKVYFPDDNVMYVEAEERIVVGEDDIDFAAAIFQEILKGPERENLNPAVRGGVKLLSLSIDENGLCTVDLSKEFETYNTGGSAMESMAIYSIVNSLCELDSIDKVKINIEGNKTAEYGGHFLLDEPFEPDKKLICSYPEAE